jgi:glutathione S-transferase
MSSLKAFVNPHLCPCIFNVRTAGIVVGVVAVVTVGKALMKARSRSKFASEVAKQKKNVVYMYAFPRMAEIRTPALSSAATKVEAFMRLAKIPYVFVGTQDYSNSPTERIPFISLNGKLTAESHFIIERIAKEFNVSLDGHLTPEEHAKGTAIRRILDDSTRLHHYRHQMVDNAPAVAAMFSKAMGAPLFLTKMFVKKMRSNLINMLNNHGQGDLTDEQYHAEWMRDVQALEGFLGNKPFFFGDRPTSYDCAAYGYLAGAVAISGMLPCPELKRIAEGPLAGFVKRMEAAVFPDLDAILKAPLPQEFPAQQ